ncbi:cadherin-like beta sandwich domain-containing protein [Candidatus Nitrospira nitrificans]|nr:cadherin-like beta sandwich domain-containing protein [Candidatus Nitrospira nitrificans]
MMRTLTVVRQYLAASFLFGIGLVAYGCGDSATVSEPAELGGLSVSTGTLEPPFNPATTDYTVQLSSDVSSTTITASPRVAGDTIRIDNQPTTSQTITLDSPGAEKSVSIVVTDSGAGGGSKSYTVRVRRDLEDNSLRALSVSSGTLAPSPFDKDTLNYSVNGVGASVTSITISATKSDQDSIMRIGSVTVPAGTPSGQATVQLGNTGSATPVSIEITRPGGSKKTYTVTINRGPSDNSFLQSLSLPPGLQLNPRFGSSITGYEVNVANNVTSITVTPRAQDTTARISVNGLATASGQPSQPILLNEPGVNASRTNINITVIAQNNNTQKVYTVTVIRAALGGNNNLSALSVRAGTTTLSLSPSPFDSNTLVYTGNVANNVTEVAVTATRQDANASITVNGQPTNSGAARTVTLIPAGQNQSTTTIPIIVTAQNSSQKTYTVNIIRAALGGNNNLQSLTVQSLNVPSHTLSPPFSQTRARTDYALDVDNNVGSITVNAIPQDSGASVRILVNGAASGTNSISLPLGPSTTEIEIIVRAPNGTEKPYSITVDRAAASSNNNLSALSVRVGNIAQPLSPPFAAGTLAYTVNVASSVNEVTVAATKADRDATMAIGSVTVPPGTLTGETTVPVNTTLSIAVTAPSGGAPKTYTVTVNRTVAEPPPPTVAPDLIREDDTCPPGIPPAECAPDFNGNPTSREDNITSVTRPRFSIPPPGAGETAKLYRDGVEEPSSFNSGDNTLRPNNPLPDGAYDITYTLSNSGSESGPSPAMTPQLQINTSAP